jgi:hypothetical protein
MEGVEALHEIVCNYPLWIVIKNYIQRGWADWTDIYPNI